MENGQFINDWYRGFPLPCLITRRYPDFFADTPMPRLCGIPTMWDPPKTIAELVYNSNFIIVYGTYNELDTGLYKQT